MQSEFKYGSIEFLTEQHNELLLAENLKPFVPFSDLVCNFLDYLSKLIMKNPAIKDYPDVFTFGFFIRKGNIEQIKKQRGPFTGHIGRGLSFHISPSNVPVNFAYSLVSGLLSGNACVVRVPSKKFPQVDLICDAINAALCIDRFTELNQYISLVRYDKSTQYSEFYSSICDIRVIWGGDDTIRNIRKYSIPARSIDITFADRYSFSVIDSLTYLSKYDYEKTAKDFFNDTYLFDQNACTSPRLIIWLGDKDSIMRAKSTFWTSLHNLLLREYKIDPIIAVNKLYNSCESSIKLDVVKVEKMPDNLIQRIQVRSLDESIVNYQCAGGSFIEYDATDIHEISTIVTNKYQTLSYIGLDSEELREWVMGDRLKGIDRIVPIGRTSDFDFNWDGYDLIQAMSRICAIK